MSEENIENIIKPERNFATTFVDQHLLPDTTFNANLSASLHVYNKN